LVQFFQAASKVLADIELMHMIRKGQFTIGGAKGLASAEQFYALTRQVRPA
jgi:hypothetical protein